MKPGTEKSAQPLISIILPVLNEASGINGMIAHLRALQGADAAEIIVVDGDARSGTLRQILGLRYPLWIIGSRSRNTDESRCCHGNRRYSSFSCMPTPACRSGHSRS